jgi:signal peptide peptidase SppA
MHPFPMLSQRVFNVPLAIHPDKAEMIVAALADRLGVAHLLHQDGSDAALAAFALDDEPALERGYEVIAGVAVIPVEGTLVAKLNCLRPYSGMTGYDGIRMNLMTALTDDAVRAIVLDIDSPGGEVAGLFDLVDMIVQARTLKPVRAILTESAYSAAYAIATACERISLPRTGHTGSIGAIVMHVDWSRALDKAGATVTLIRSADRKYEASEFEPLSRDARVAMQANVDAIAALFIDTVAQNRGISADVVAETKAACFRADDSVALGLADAVESPDVAFRALLDDLP